MNTIFHNGKIYIEKGHFEEAILIKDDIIQSIGSSEEILQSSNPQDDFQLYDCKGKTIIPGLNDSHLHFMQYGETRNQADIEGAASIEDIIARCRRFIAEHPDKAKRGLHAMGWNQDLFTGEKRMPDRFDLDKISTEIPIVLERVCGHIAAGNTALIHRLGLNEHSPQYASGEFLRDESGFPTGIFKGGACIHAKEAIPDFTMEEKRQIIIDTMKHAASLGLTSIQSNDIGADFSDSGEAFAMMRDIYKKGEASVRYRHQMCFASPEEFREFIRGEWTNKEYTPDSWLTLGPLKLYKDGSLGARTALMTDGYPDEPENKGLEWLSSGKMDEYCAIAKEAGIQVITHAIGNQAISDTIDSYEKVFTGGKNKLRHGIVHCQITDRQLIERIKRDNIPVFAQPIFIDFDMHIAEQLCGKELAATSYAFGTMLRKGIHLSYSTDCPVETCNPFVTIYEAVTRKDRSGFPQNGYFPEEAVDVETAVDAYTWESAYAEFAEHRKGRLKPGYCADLVVLDRDIFTIDPMEIKEVLPLLTMTGGRVVYRR